jgi:hypothetical protein
MRADRFTSWPATATDQPASQRPNSPYPPHFAGPIPDAYGKFDEAIYVLNGGLTVLGEQGPRGVGTGASAFAPTSMWCSSGRCRPS